MNIQKEEMCNARCRGREGTELPCLCWVHYPPRTSMFSVIQKFSESYTFKMFMEPSLCRQVSSQSSAPLPFPGDGDGGGVEFSKLLMMAWSLVTSPHPKLSRSPPRVASLKQKTLFYHPAKSREFRSSVRDQNQRPNVRTKDILSALIIRQLQKFQKLCARKWNVLKLQVGFADFFQIRKLVATSGIRSQTESHC